MGGSKVEGLLTGLLSEVSTSGLALGLSESRTVALIGFRDRDLLLAASVGCRDRDLLLSWGLLGCGEEYLAPVVGDASANY